MASVTRRWSGHNFQRSSTAWVESVEYDVAYAISAYDAETQALSYAGINTDPNSPFTSPSCPLMYYSGVGSRDEGINRWIVTINFSTSPLGFFPDPSNPLNDPTVYTWQIGSQGEAVDVDARGNPITSTAGVPMSGATRNFPTVTLIATRNEPVYNPQIALQYVGHVASKPMAVAGLFTIAAGIMLCRSYQPISEASLNSPYQKCQYAFEMKQPYTTNLDSAGLTDSWRSRLINQSRLGWYKDSSGNNQQGYFGRGVKGRTSGFVETSEDVLLDVNGLPLAPKNALSTWVILDPVEGAHTPVACPNALSSDIAIDVDPKTGVVFLKYLMFPSVDFAGLNL